MARKVRHEVGIYKTSNWLTPLYVDATPWVGSAEDLFELEAKRFTFERGTERKTEEELRAAGWPTSPQEITTRLKRVIPRLQSGTHKFWDPGLSDWYISTFLNEPHDTEKVCKPAYLHAELWRNQDSGEELWALVALREGWRVPDEAIEEALWSWVTADTDVPDEVETEYSGGVFEF